MRRLVETSVGNSLLIALLCVVALVAINEIGFRESTVALADLQRARQTGGAVTRLLQDVLDSETGQRGYLLTGDPKYLQPYVKGTQDITAVMEILKTEYASSLDEQPVYARLAEAVANKMSEMELTVRLRQSGDGEASRFVLTTDVGRRQMADIRMQADRLIESSTHRAQLGQSHIARTLFLARAGIATMALMALGAFYLFLRQTRALRLSNLREQESLIRERDELEQQVRERTASLAELATHLQVTREDERSELARELHDELGALLTAAKLDVVRLKSRMGTESIEFSQRINHLTETLNSGIALKRRIVEDLRPSSLAHLGLVASIEILIRDFAEMYHMEIKSSLDPVTLDDARQLTIFRLIQESLTTVHKFAHAHHVQIHLRNFETYVTVAIEDDGAGFESTMDRSSTNGLAGLRHRVSACGGRLTVTSGEKGGTRIFAAIPSRGNSFPGQAPDPQSGAVLQAHRESSHTMSDGIPIQGVNARR